MGLFDLFNKLDTISNNGLNLIHDKTTKDLLYAFNKKNGKIQGLLQVFYSVSSSGNNPNYKRTNVGFVRQEYFFIDGLPDGYFKEYDSKGNLYCHIENIKTYTFNFNSNFNTHFLKSKLLFSDKYQLNGFVNEYYSNGDLSSEKKVENNELISSKNYYKKENNEENIQLSEIFSKLKGIDFKKVNEKVFTPFTLSDDMKGKWFYGASTIFLLYQIYDNDEYEDDLNKLFRINNIQYDNHEINYSGANVWEGDGFKIELLITKNIPYSIIFISNENIVNVGLTTIITLKDKEGIVLNWIYGIDAVYDYETLNKEFHTHNIPLYWKDSEDGVESIFIKTIDKRIAFSLIDQIIEENGGKDLFKSLQNIENWEYLYEGDIFHIGYLTANECIRINKPNPKFKNISNRKVDYGISVYDKKLRNLIKGLNKILYNIGEGSTNGKLCIDGENIYALIDSLEESIVLFQRIVSNYNLSHDVLVLTNEELYKLINQDGLEYVNDDFRLLLIREFISYKFFIFLSDDFFSDSKFISNTTTSEIEKTHNDNDAPKETLNENDISFAEFLYAEILNTSNEYYENGQYQDGIDSLIKFLDLFPINSSILNTLALGYYYLGDYNLAIENSNKCIEIDSNENSQNTEHYINRGKINIKLNNIHKAIEDCKKALELDPDCEEAEELLKSLI